ncbi:tetratricopeptide repeat protein [Sphingobium fluviale]|uniref:Tetratricopeptide repeat protein n=2 Tax=Sphingobium fluviale TaxID=2506423 RepID=A0A4Q1KKV5_9SPHN|nr:tetratricopeptide repeat protein [Sphingobium fluviale]
MIGIWQRFGRWIVVAVVVGLAAFGGWLWWDHHSKQVSGETAEKAQDVLRSAATGQAPDAAALAVLKGASQPGYRAAALLTEAGVTAQKGDVAKAIALYGAIAGNEDIAQPYRDLATVRKVALGFEQMQPQAVIDTLKPLAVAGNPWFGSAGEMSAIAYMKMGKKDVAGAVFAAIAKDKTVPATVRSRARQMAGLLGVDALLTEEDANGA